LQLTYTPLSLLAWHVFFVILCLCRKCSFCWQPTPETSWSHEAYLLFPVHLDGTLLDNAKTMKAKKEHYSTSDVLQIFRQVKRSREQYFHYAFYLQFNIYYVLFDTL
jgi:hypothetical protein